MQVSKEYLTTHCTRKEGLLDGGASLSPVTVAYETCGKLNPARNNAILICHAFSGDSHVAGHYSDEPPDTPPGWWDFMVGPGKGIDTDRYFIICCNILGSCMGSTGPSSTNPATDSPYGANFPMVTIGDMVTAQKRVLEHLGISTLHSIIGGSVGGMQVLEWCVRYPEMLRSAIPIATTMRHSALAIAFNEVARQAIMADPHWNKGNYYADVEPNQGLAVARMIAHITYLSDEAMRRKFGRNLQDKEGFSFNFDVDFQVESYLHHQGSKFAKRFDANSVLFISRAADYFDLTDNITTSENLHDIPANVAKFLVISYTSDWLYPTYQSKELVQALKRSGQDVSFCEIEADCGHDAFLIKDQRLTSLLGGFLNGVSTS